MGGHLYSYCMFSLPTFYLIYLYNIYTYVMNVGINFISHHYYYYRRLHECKLSNACSMSPSSSPPLRNIAVHTHIPVYWYMTWTCSRAGGTMSIERGRTCVKDGNMFNCPLTNAIFYMMMMMMNMATII